MKEVFLKGDNSKRCISGNDIEVDAIVNEYTDMGETIEHVEIRKDS